MSNSFSLISPLAYNGQYPASNTGSISGYSQTQLMIGDAYKEQQYWLSIYNFAQQYGGNYKGLSIEDITTQLLRVQEKLSGLKNIILPANEAYLKWENQVNQGIKGLFKGS